MDSAFTKNNSRRANSRFGLGQYELDTQLSALDGSRVVSIAREQHGRPQGRTSSGPSTLVQRNIAVGSRRTTVRLEPLDVSLICMPGREWAWVSYLQKYNNTQIDT